MKRMSRQEFLERNQAEMRARKIYVPHITKNISISFDIYIRVLAEQEHDRFINNATTRRSPIDGYIRPKCPECDTNFMLRIIAEPKGKNNVHGYKTCWECPICGHEEYSTRTINDWIKELKMEENTRKERDAYPWGCWKTIE